MRLLYGASSLLTYNEEARHRSVVYELYKTSRTLVGACKYAFKVLEYMRSGSHMLDMYATGSPVAGAGSHLRQNVGAAMAAAVALCFFRQETSHLSSPPRSRCGHDLGCIHHFVCVGVPVGAFRFAMSGDSSHVPSLYFFVEFFFVGGFMPNHTKLCRNKSRRNPPPPSSAPMLGSSPRTHTTVSAVSANKRKHTHSQGTHRTRAEGEIID